MTFNIGDKVRVLDKGFWYGLVGTIQSCNSSHIPELRPFYNVKYYEEDYQVYGIIKATNIELVDKSKKENKMINNLSIKFTRKIDCDFSANQWGLLTNKFPRKEIEEVASNLNSHLKSLVNDAHTKERVRELMLDKMDVYKNYGASDTEPRAFLEQVLDVVYFDPNKR